MTVHPIRSFGHATHHLREVERRGENPETPLLAMVGLAAFLLPLAALLMLLAFGAAWLVTGSAV